MKRLCNYLQSKYRWFAQSEKNPYIQYLTGFTLIEIMVVASVITVVIAAALSASTFIFRTQFFIMEQNNAVEDGKNSLSIMVREMRELTWGADGSYPIKRADPYYFEFYSDIDIDFVAEKVRYFIDGSDLKKGVTEPSESPPKYNPTNEAVVILSSFANNAANNTPMFQYYDTNNNLLPASPFIKDIRLAETRLLININPSRAPDDIALVSLILLRNLKND